MPVTPGSGTRDCAVRRLLCVFPRYAPSFGSFEFSYPLTDGIRAFMPPQGLLVIAAAAPASWQVRFVDENIDRQAGEADFAWARGGVRQRHARAAAADRAYPPPRACVRPHRGARRLLGVGLPRALSGFRLSACRRTGRRHRRIVRPARTRCGAPAAADRSDDARAARAQRVSDAGLRAGATRPLSSSAASSSPAAAPINASSATSRRSTGASALQDRRAGHRRARQDAGLRPAGAVYFVDDNFIAHRRAVRELLPHLVDWQKRNRYPFSFACEATLNIAKRPEILSLMREAMFETVFCGIETTGSGRRSRRSPRNTT